MGVDVRFLSRPSLGHFPTAQPRLVVFHSGLLVSWSVKVGTSPQVLGLL